MIPKRIFMVWLGNAVPAYAQAAADMFRRAYADYDIEFIRYKVADLRRIRAGRTGSDIDSVLGDAMHEVFDLRENGKYSVYIKNQLMIYGKKMKNIMLLSDIFRLGLLNAFGGIYIDVDSVPAKRFDDALMSSERFCVCRESGGKTFSDNYFMGQSQGFDTWTNPMDASLAKQVFDSTKRDAMF